MNEPKPIEAKTRDGSCALASGSAPSDAAMLDWLEDHCRSQWPFGNQVSFEMLFIMREPFHKQPCLREAVAQAMGEAQNDPDHRQPPGTAGKRK
jgi:hypothetical protein